MKKLLVLILIFLLLMNVCYLPQILRSGNMLLYGKKWLCAMLIMLAQSPSISILLFGRSVLMEGRTWWPEGHQIGFDLFFFFLIAFCCHCSGSKSFPSLCNTMNSSKSGSSVLCYFPEVSQIHVHWVDGAI